LFQIPLRPSTFLKKSNVCSAPYWASTAAEARSLTVPLPQMLSVSVNVVPETVPVVSATPFRSVM